MKHLSAYASKRMAQFETMSVESLVAWTLTFLAVFVIAFMLFGLSLVLKAVLPSIAFWILSVGAGIWLVMVATVTEKKITQHQEFLNLCDSRPAQIELREVK